MYPSIAILGPVEKFNYEFKTKHGDLMKKLILASVVTMIFSGVAFTVAQAKPGTSAKKTMTEPSAEQREKMAANHEKMATCLRSTSPLSDCKKEMMHSCHETMGKEGCSMMEHKDHDKMKHEEN